MRPTRSLPAALVLVVFLVSALLGTGVAGYPASREPAVGTGSATVEVVSVPDTVTIERTRFGAGTYRFTGAATTLRVETVRGNPDLTYAIDVPALQLADVAHYPLAGERGELTVRSNPVEISPDRVEAERYEGTVAVWIRSGDRYRNVVQQRVTFEVEHE